VPGRKSFTGPQGKKDGRPSAVDGQFLIPGKREAKSLRLRIARLEELEALLGVKGHLCPDQIVEGGLMGIGVPSLFDVEHDGRLNCITGRYARLI